MFPIFSVDATEVEGLCKYVNDSPAPYHNCKMKKIVDPNGAQYLCLFASKDIPIGTELR